MDDEYIDIELRAPSTVAERCIILAAIVRRLWIESSATSSSSDNWFAEVFDLREWLRTESLWNALTALEIDVLQRHVGDLSEDDVAELARHVEGLATLGWALGLAELAPLGNLGDVSPVVHTVPAPWDNSAAWISGTRLRHEEDIARERDRAEMLAWRIKVEGPSRISRGAERISYLAAIQKVAREVRETGLSSGAGNEITIDDRPLTSFDDRDLERLEVVADERLRALNWLCGFGATWADAPLDV